MGRKNKTYYKDLHQQAYDRLTEMLAFGESKKEAVAAGTEKDKIFSVNTYKSYWKHIKYFLRYIKQKHPECTTLKGAKKYVNEWLQSRADEELSAWTVQLEAKALGKLYGIAPDDEDYFKPPKRNREDIKRSRSDCVRDEHFSKTNNDELIKFCRGTGLRRRELGELRGKDLVRCEQIAADAAQLEQIPADGSGSVRSSAKTRRRSWSGSPTRPRKRRCGGTSIRAPTFTPTARNTPRRSIRHTPGRSGRSPTTG